MPTYRCSQNGVGDLGGMPLAEALAVNRALRALNLSSNVLGRRTALALSEG